MLYAFYVNIAEKLDVSYNEIICQDDTTPKEDEKLKKLVL